MPAQDTSEIKEKIISSLRKNGPSLPVHIAREIESSSLFTSAFLSELVSEKRVRISNMRVGNSPIYYLQGQEPKLENFSNHLKGKEKEALMLLKDKKFLKDSTQDPAIRVALREIKDFATPFKNSNTGEIIWRIYNVSEEGYKSKSKPKPREEPELQKTEKQEEKKERQEKEELDIFDDKPKKAKKTKTRKKGQGKDSKFFNKIKEYLNGNSIELIDIENFSKGQISLRVKENGSEKLLVAFDKKRLSENDISKAAKKSSEINLPYIILSKGGPLKRIETLIKDLKNLSSIKQLK
jgi:hypothetical protein